jgi:hypothetical protein
MCIFCTNMSSQRRENPLFAKNELPTDHVAAPSFYDLSTHVSRANNGLAFGLFLCAPPVGSGPLEPHVALEPGR